MKQLTIIFVATLLLGCGTGDDAEKVKTDLFEEEASQPSPVAEVPTETKQPLVPGKYLLNAVEADSVQNGKIDFDVYQSRSTMEIHSKAEGERQQVTLQGTTMLHAAGHTTVFGCATGKIILSFNQEPGAKKISQFQFDEFSCKNGDGSLGGLSADPEGWLLEEFYMVGLDLHRRVLKTLSDGQTVLYLYS